MAYKNQLTVHPQKFQAMVLHSYKNVKQFEQIKLETENPKIKARNSDQFI